MVPTLFSFYRGLWGFLSLLGRLGGKQAVNRLMRAQTGKCRMLREQRRNTEPRPGGCQKAFWREWCLSWTWWTKRRWLHDGKERGRQKRWRRAGTTGTVNSFAQWECDTCGKAGVGKWAQGQEKWKGHDLERSGIPWQGIWNWSLRWSGIIDDKSNSSDLYLTT